MLKIVRATTMAIALGLMGLGLAAPVSAQTPAAPAAPTAATPAAKKPAIRPKSERTPESLACSADADKAGLKGKERQKFRRKCLSDAKKAAKKS